MPNHKHKSQYEMDNVAIYSCLIKRGRLFIPRPKFQLPWILLRDRSIFKENDCQLHEGLNKKWRLSVLNI